MNPGEVKVAEGEIELNAGRKTRTLAVTNRGGGIVARGGVIDAPGASPVNSAHAHRTGLAGSIHFAARKLERLQAGAGIPYRHHLCMGSRIIMRSYTVAAPANDLIVFHDHTSKRTAFAVVHPFPCQPDGFLHILLLPCCHIICV